MIINFITYYANKFIMSPIYIILLGSWRFNTFAKANDSNVMPSALVAHCLLIIAPQSMQRGVAAISRKRSRALARVSGGLG